MTTNNVGGLLEQWRALEDGGIPLEPPEYRVGGSLNGGLTIRLRPYPYEDGLIRAHRIGRVTYALPVFVQRNAPGRTIIRDATLHVPWDDSIEWLEEDTRRNRGWYTFSEESYPPKHEYAREMVLNHRMKCTLSGGAFREGMLLAVGKVLPPENCRNGDRIPVTLSIVDQWGCETSATFKLRLERRHALGKKIEKNTRGSLLSRRDKIVARFSRIAPPLKKPSRKDEEGLRRTFERFALRHYRCHYQKKQMDKSQPGKAKKSAA